MRRPIKYQLIKLQITGAGDFPISAESDKTYKKITGIQLTTTDIDSLKDAVFSRFEIDSNDIYPDGWETKLLVSGDGVTPNDRFYDLDERADGSTISGIF